MTNEETIEVLDDMKVKIDIPKSAITQRKRNEALDMAIKALEKQQNTKGNWIHWTDDRKDYVTCSCCEYGEEGEVLLKDKTPFCPCCGADMREGAE